MAIVVRVRQEIADTICMDLGFIGFAVIPGLGVGRHNIEKEVELVGEFSRDEEDELTFEKVQRMEKEVKRLMVENEGKIIRLYTDIC